MKLTNKSEIDQFFREIHDEGNDVNLSCSHMEVFNTMSRIIGHTFFVVDFLRRKFVYVSNHPLFLCGHSPSEALEMGYAFFKEIVVEEDLELLVAMDKKGHDLISQLSLEERMESIISVDYRLKQPEGANILVTQKNTLFFVEGEEPRFALCTINLSANGTPGHMKVIVNNVPHDYMYSFKTRRWKTVHPVQFSKREKEIITLSTQGFSNEEIANTLFIDISTVKFHRRNIFSKLGVKNIAEAIVSVYNNKLI